MSKALISSIFSAALLAGLGCSADAAPLRFSHILGAHYSRIRLSEGAPVLAPFQHVRFCIEQPEECVASDGAPTQVEMNSDLLPKLTEVDAEVNESIKPTRKNAAQVWKTGWRVSPPSGDCNDYAVTKRHILIEWGLPPSALILAVVKTSWGEGHLVLVVKSNVGDFVLDNLTNAIRPLAETDYDWIAVQSHENPRRWVQAKREEESFPKSLPFFASAALFDVQPNGAIATLDSAGDPLSNRRSWNHPAFVTATIRPLFAISLGALDVPARRVEA